MYAKNPLSESKIMPPEVLEFDITHGVNLEDPSQPLILYCNRNRALNELNKQIRWLTSIIALALVFLVMMPVYDILVRHQDQYAVLIVFCSFAAVYSMAWILAYAYRRRCITKLKRPVLEMRPAGLSVQWHFTNFDLIPWEEIEEVRAYSVFPCRMVGIVPKNLNKTLANAPQSTRLAALSNASAVSVYRLVGLFLAPINVPEEFFPLSANEVVELINARKAYYLGLAAQETGAESEAGKALLDDVSDDEVQD